MTPPVVKELLKRRNEPVIFMNEYVKTENDQINFIKGRVQPTETSIIYIYVYMYIYMLYIYISYCPEHTHVYTYTQAYIDLMFVVSISTRLWVYVVFQLHIWTISRMVAI